MMILQVQRVPLRNASGYYAADGAVLLRLLCKYRRAQPWHVPQVASAVAIVQKDGTPCIFATEARTLVSAGYVVEQTPVRRADVDVAGARIQSWCGRVHARTLEQFSLPS